MYVRWGNALLQFGVLCRQLGAYTEGQAALKKAAPFLRGPLQKTQYLECKVNLAISYMVFGDYVKARLLYDTVKLIFDTMHKDDIPYYQLISVYNNLADIYSQTGNTQKALAYIKKAERAFNDNKIQTEFGALYFADYIQVLVNVADAYKNMHYTDSALMKCNEAEDSLKNKQFDDLTANILQERASIYIEEQKFSKAMQLCKQSLQIMDTLPQRQEFYDATLLNLGALYQRAGQYGLADSIYRKEVQYLYGRGLTASYNIQQALIGLCKSLLFQKKYKQAADSLVKAGNLALRVLTENFASMPENDQLQYSAVFDDVFDMLYTLLGKANTANSAITTLAFALQLQRKNMVLASQTGLLARLRGSNDTVLMNTYPAWLGVRQMLARQYALPYGDRLLNTDSLEQVSETLEKQASTVGNTGGFSNNAIALDKFVRQDKNVADIEFVRYNYITQKTEATGAGYGAFVIKGGESTPTFVPLCSEAALRRLMQDEKQQLISGAQLTQKLYSPPATEAANLYALLWQPLAKHLQGATVVNYSPAGLLNNISFHALYNGKGWLANSFTLRCFASLADVNAAQTGDRRPNEISLWGNMDYNNSDYIVDATNKTDVGGTGEIAFSAPGLKPEAQKKSISKAPLQAFYTDELSAIKKAFAEKNIPYSNYEKATATEENFKQQCPTIKGVLHISTHGFYTPYDKKEAEGRLPGSFIAGNANPLFRCGLAFAGVNYYWMKGQPKPNHDDGILTGYEVSQLDLHNVQLVTLSACETGLGDITATEGNLGLQRAFKLAGVKKLLVSLWQVPAKQTQQLLTKFYTYWLGGKTPAGALQQAETDMQAASYPPYYWAGFVLVE